MNFIINNLDDFDLAAQQFVAIIGAHRFFAFQGVMGAGKTTFIKYICQHLGVKDAVNSPTFSIINEYNGTTPYNLIYHFDFYRINNNNELYDLGIYEYFNSGALCLLEWADNIKDFLPNDIIYVNITLNNDRSRCVSFL
jgi:tRNA threonylcarbamoyladenosine biosynthesis protein TsaE